MDQEQFKRRTQALAVRVIRAVEALPRGRATDVLVRQVIRSSASVSSNYRAACRARSRADFIAKMGIVEEEEADETAYWLEMIADSGIVHKERVADVTREVQEVIAVVVSSINTARRNANMARR